MKYEILGKTIRIGDSKGKYTSFSDIFQSRGPIGACSKETVKLKKKEGKNAELRPQ